MAPHGPLIQSDEQALFDFQYVVQSFVVATERITQEHAGLGWRDWHVLLALAAPRNATPITARVLGQWLQMDRLEVSAVIDGLVRRGFVRQLRERSERRRVLLTVTPAGKSQLTPLVRSAFSQLLATGPELLRAVRGALAHATAATRPLPSTRSRTRPQPRPAPKRPASSDRLSERTSQIRRLLDRLAFVRDPAREEQLMDQLRHESAEARRLRRLLPVAAGGGELPGGRAQG